MAVPTDPTRSISPIMRFIVVTLLRILALLAIVAFALPVVLLPLATSVPAPVWVLLAVVDVAVVFALFRLRWTLRAAGGAVAGSLVVALLEVVASQIFASTPAITDASGKPLPNSIATLEKVKLGGSDQWITIRGHDVHKPVLLFLAGGPVWFEHSGHNPWISEPALFVDLMVNKVLAQTQAVR